MYHRIWDWSQTQRCESDGGYQPFFDSRPFLLDEKTENYAITRKILLSTGLALQNRGAVAPDSQTYIENDDRHKIFALQDDVRVGISS